MIRPGFAVWTKRRAMAPKRQERSLPLCPKGDIPAAKPVADLAGHPDDLRAVCDRLLNKGRPFFWRPLAKGGGQPSAEAIE